MRAGLTVHGIALLALLMGVVDVDAEAVTGRTERGPVTASVSLEPAEVAIGDPVVLTLEVTAQPGVELLMPEFGTSLERFTIEEFVPRESLDPQGRTLSSQRYHLQTLSSGEHSIPPITIEFVDRRPGQRPAPEDEDAYELLTERLPFVVRSVVPESAGDGLKPPLGPLKSLQHEPAAAWPWLLLLAVPAVALLILWRRRRGRARRRPAHAVALARLAALEGSPRPDAAAMDAFFVELSDLVRQYLEERFALHAPELTTEEFLDVAAVSPDLTRGHRSFLNGFLRSADRVKFARHVPDAGHVDGILKAVREFLLQTSCEPALPGSNPGSGEAAHA